ncbi:hypothetical protein HID58_002499, partial [Brassica napus]
SGAWSRAGVVASWKRGASVVAWRRAMDITRPIVAVGMTNKELLTIVPMTLQFPFELEKPISCYFYLKNQMDNNVAFKLNNPGNYSVRHTSGVVLPRSISKVHVTMQALNETPSDMHRNDNVIATPGVTANEVTHEMVLIPIFSAEVGKQVEQSVLRVTYTVFQSLVMEFKLLLGMSSKQKLVQESKTQLIL